MPEKIKINIVDGSATLNICTLYACNEQNYDTEFNYRIHLLRFRLATKKPAFFLFFNHTAVVLLPFSQFSLCFGVQWSNARLLICHTTTIKNIIFKTLLQGSPNANLKHFKEVALHERYTTKKKWNKTVK